MLGEKNLKQNWKSSIHFLYYLSYTRSQTLECKSRNILDRLPNYYKAQSHTFTHYGQFREDNQPTKHVFGLGKKN